MAPVRIYRLQGKEYVYPFVARDYLGFDKEVYDGYVSEGKLRVVTVGKRQLVELDSVESILHQRQAKIGG